MSKKADIIKEDILEEFIFIIRGHKVMLSADLADLYGIETKALVQAVKRNIERFPEDFMFQLRDIEYKNLKSQIVTSSWGGIRRANPYAFTEQGVAMLSSVLRSKRATLVNVEIMRTFVRLRRVIATHKEFAEKLADLEQRIGENELDIRTVAQVIRDLMQPKEDKPKRKIGFSIP